MVDLDETKEKQLNLALNKITGSWDNEKLRSVLKELGDDALGIGFSEAEIDALENDLAAALDAISCRKNCPVSRKHSTLSSASTRRNTRMWRLTSRPMEKRGWYS